MHSLEIEWTDGFVSRSSDGTDVVVCEVDSYIDALNFGRVQILFEFEKVSHGGSAPDLLFETSLDKDGPWEMLETIGTITRTSSEKNYSVRDASNPVYRWVRWRIRPGSSTSFDVVFRLAALLRQ